MFNRVAPRHNIATHNIRDIMGKSKKRTPITCWACCKSQKRGKQFCNRRFRRRTHQRITIGDMERLPLLTREVMESWDLGGDGKSYIHLEPTDKYYIKLMRK